MKSFVHYTEQVDMKFSVHIDHLREVTKKTG